jgi:hypothetical protein
VNKILTSALGLIVLILSATAKEPLSTFLMFAMQGSKQNLGFEALECEDKRESYLGFGQVVPNASTRAKGKGLQFEYFSLAQALDPVMTHSSRHGNLERPKMDKTPSCWKRRQDPDTSCKGKYLDESE